MGNSPLRSLTREHDSKVTQERGRARSIGLIHEDDERIVNQVVQVLPTIHPAYVLRSLGESKHLFADFEYARELAGGATVRGPGETEWTLITPSNVASSLDFLGSQQVLAVDIETGTEDPILNGALIPTLGEILSVSFSWAPNRSLVAPGDLLRKYPKRFARFFETTDVQFVWHNGKFDSSFIRSQSLPARVDEDTMLMHYVLSEGVRETHGLKELAGDLLGADPNYDAPVRKYAPKRTLDYHGYAKVPRDILYPYNAKDTDYTFQLYQMFAAELNKPENASLNYAYEHILLPASPFLQKVEAHGVYVSRPYLHELRGALSKDLAGYLASARAASGDKHLNPNAPAQVLAVLRAEGHRINDTRKETLAELPRTDLVEAISKYRKTTKALGTYVDGIDERVQSDGRVHPTFLLHGTVTGRLSSRNPNMQNVPRDARVRNLFQAPEGKVLVELDYSQAELRVLAVLSGDRNLLDVYYNGRDLHDEVSKQLFPGWEDYADTVKGKEQRIRAKFVNFGIAYGRGADSLVTEFKMPMASAKQLINRWWRTFPEAHKYIFNARRAIRNGSLESPFGRRRRFAVIPDNKRSINALENEAANFSIQSTASDLTLLSAMYMSDELGKLGAHIINLVHDSILIECGPAEAEEVGAYASRVMMQTPIDELGWDIIPFTADYKVAMRWGDLK
jgi:DNA polymerase I-like protein with 3'-5' exonuclease and polymerase domains